MRDLDEVIETLTMLTAWDKTYRQVLANWPELKELILCAQDLGEDDIEQKGDKAIFPNEFNHFVVALARLLSRFSQEKPCNL